MNMTAITSTITPAQLPAKPAAPRAEKTVPGTPKAFEDPMQARARAFYTREAQPWMKDYSETLVTNERRAAAKAMYLHDLTNKSYDELKIQDKYYATIRNDLGVYRPEIANKNFSYTLGDDGKIKILDPDNSLAEHEVDYLTMRFNEEKDFKNSVIRHAKMAMALVDHDDKAFAGKYKLDLLNIQSTLDYRKLITSNPEKMRDAFIRQILENGEKREEPLVDVVA